MHQIGRMNYQRKLSLTIIGTLLPLMVVTSCTQRSNVQTPSNFNKPVSREPISYSGRTIVFFDRGHGTQIEYFAPDGSAFLWYPGNRNAVVGKYRKQGKNICFQYGQNTYNPITKTRGGRWQCQPSVFHRFSAQKACKGDPFKLASGNVPYRLEKNSYTSSKITQLCDSKV